MRTALIRGIPCNSYIITLLNYSFKRLPSIVVRLRWISRVPKKVSKSSVDS